jgi:hypothetical protein
VVAINDRPGLHVQCGRVLRRLTGEIHGENGRSTLPGLALASWP